MSTLAVSNDAKSSPIDPEEPGGKRRSTLSRWKSAYSLRYDRVAAVLFLAHALLWALILVRNWVAPVDPNSLQVFETILRAIADNVGSGLIVAGLIGFALVDAVIGVLLFRGFARPKTLVLGRFAVAVVLSGFYYAATHDFETAFFLLMLQGLALVLVTRNAGVVLVYPGGLWLIVFFIVPLVSIVAYSLGRGTSLGTVDLSTTTLENYQRILQPVGASGLVYLSVVVRTIWVAFLTTVLCLVIGYPFAFWMARQPVQLRNVLMLLVMIPFWTNLLIRTYAWVIILRRDGLINNLLMNVLGFIHQPLDMMNTPGALMLGLLYGYLPYAILPLYTAIERLDPKMVEAANDLYAPPWQAFYRIILPLTMPGIIAASILVFIPSVGTYVISNLLGGGRVYLIGNLLEQQFSSSTGDKAFGAAFGVVLTVLMLVTTLIYFRLGGKSTYAV